MVVEHLSLKECVPGGFLGSRAKAQPIRRDMERVFDAGGEVVLDFAGVEATQSFIDELVGVLILQHGPSLIKRVNFRNCTKSMQGIVRFVLADRAAQYAQAH